MARYGDLDAVKLKVQRHLIPNTDDDGTVSVEDAERWFLKLLDEEPTADVVPRSELEVYENINQGLEGELSDAYYDLESTKSEVAREIFEEIERLTASVYNDFMFNREGVGMIGTTLVVEFSDKIDLAIAKLKKKYTEGEG